MAFQVGTRVRPELGNADFSGFGRAAEIQAASLAQLGATIGGAIQERAEKKKEKALNKQAKQTLFGMVKNRPELANFFGLPEDFTLDDMTPFVDVMGAKPTLALITQLNLASMQAQTPSLPSVTQVQKFNEYLATLGGLKDVILKNGMLYDEDLVIDDPIPFNDPIVQQALQTEEGRILLTGYGDAEFISTEEDEDIEVSVPTDESVEAPVFDVTRDVLPPIRPAQNYRPF